MKQSFNYAQTETRLPMACVLCFLFLFLTLNSGLGQSTLKQKPELYSQLASYENIPDDERRIITMCRIIKLYSQISTDSAYRFAEFTLKAAEGGSVRTQALAFEAYADILNLKGYFKEAAEYFDRSAEALKPLKDSLSIAQRYHVTAYLGGWLNPLLNYPTKVGNCEKALRIYENRAMWPEAGRTSYTLGLILYNWAVHQPHTDPKDREALLLKALKYDRLAELYYQKVHFRFETASSLASQADVHLELSQMKEVRMQATQALRIYRQNENLFGQARCYGHLSHLYEIDGKIDSAIHFSNQNLKLFKELGFVAFLPIAHNRLINLYKAKQDYKNAFQNAIDRQVVYDSLFSIERQKIVAQIQNSYEARLQDDQIKLLKMEAQLASKQLTQILVASGFVVLILAFVFFYQRTRLKANLANLQSKIFQKHIETIEQERSRIAQELHDNIGSQLSSFKRTYFPAEDAEGITQLDGLINEIRNISHDLAPTLAKITGLMPLVEKLILETREASSIDFKLQSFEFKESFPAESIVQIYRTIQEAINNIVKHSNARHADVQFFGYPEQLTITIEDDGIGFNLEAQSGFGLNSMKARVALLNGKIEINSSAGKGCLIVIEIPIQSMEIRR